MARKARIRAASGIYYVRLNSFSPLFLQERDLTELINLLITEKETDFCEVYAYCLIDCEAHIVIKEGIGGISANIMRLKSAFASYYNTIYVRKGSLFKDRFFSVPLEDNAELLKYVRHVHRVPLNLGYKVDFEGSSYSDYFKNRPLLSSAEIISLFKSAVDFKIYTETEIPNTQMETDIPNSETAVFDSETRIADTEKAQITETEISNTDKSSEQSEQTAKNNSDTAKNNPDNDAELKAQIKELLKDVTAQELESLTDEQYKLLITRIIRLTNSTPQAVARVLEIDADEI